MVILLTSIMFDTMFDRNIFGSSLEVFGTRRKSSGIFEKFRKMKKALTGLHRLPYMVLR